MSGHSKWDTIKRKKGVADAKRGAIFTKLGNLITIAAREKGGDPSINFTLRMAVDKAKAANMPKDNIEKAIKRGTGELAGEIIEELIYEGVGPVNSQFVIKVLTDNKNRSAANIRHIFSKHGGSLASVMWNFEQKGVLRLAKKGENILTDDMELELIEVGAEDIKKDKDEIIIFSSIGNLQSIKKLMDQKNISTESAEIEYLAKDKIDINDEDKEKIKNFIFELENLEEVADYYTNVNI